ncbi:hypothetical protein [Lentzea flava]|uniref:Uncharacterized protein n=1 Tax=Lentzea flava TaxID=103732 RepID=A0ABQ2UUV1_9PSEU|nr:hypothetical protein [Lentzea flava]MCP2200728.1 hypothetical protein [Lentzea flava]GGU55162.1 hypothetical protein GCM10010178_54480 [Lentzea flava]
MTGEKLRGRGLAVAAAGVLLVAWVIVFAATTEVGNPPVLVAAAVPAGMVSLCAVAAGLVASRVTEHTAPRVRHVFVVLSGAALALLYPSYWLSFNIEPVGMPGELLLGAALVLLVPLFGALGLVVVIGKGVHRMVIEKDGPLVPGSGEGAPARRIQELGTVLVVVGALLAVAVVAVSSMSGKHLPFYLFSGLAVTFAVVLLGMSLTRVTDVHMARRKNLGPYVGVISGLTLPVATFGFETVTSVLFGVVLFGAVVLVVVALLVMGDYTGESHTTWRERRRWRVSR